MELLRAALVWVCDYLALGVGDSTVTLVAHVAGDGAGPGIKGARVTIVGGVSSCSGKRVRTIVDHDAGNIGMLSEQRRKHPGVRVPEDHARIAIAREARRPKAGWAIWGDAGIECVLAGADGLLESWVAVDANIGLPDGIPCSAILLFKSSEASVSGLLRFCAGVGLGS